MIKNQAMGGKTNKALLFLGLFLGLVSAGLVVVYLRSESGDGGGSVSEGVITPVVVAADAIPASTRITEDMVVLKEISADAVLAGAFQDPAQVVGQVTRVPLVAGEQVIPTKVAATGAAITDADNPPLAYVVPEGMRAVSVQISSLIGASGLIRPGDYVDVILTVQVQEEEEDTTGGSATTNTHRDQIARTILQNAQVLSIDQDVTLPAAAGDGGEAASSSDEDAITNPEATTVTLALSPVHGEVLTVAEACGEAFSGRLALALRGFGDSTPVQTRSVWADDGAPPSCAEIMGLSSLQ